MAKYKKIAVGWMSKTGVISIRSEDEKIVLDPRSKLALFPVKDKLTDRHPDFDLCLNLEE